MHKMRTPETTVVCAVLALFVLLVGIGPAAAEETLVSIQTPRGVKQSFALLRPEKPIASVILLAGGHGALGLTDASSMRWGALNFLVRTRRKFAALNLMVAVLDAPGDQASGMSPGFRVSEQHARDIAAVAAHLKSLADVPVWLIGTSMGTLSAASAALSARGIEGLVLTSTITHTREGWDIAKSLPLGVASLDFRQARLPILIVAHERDACDLTPPGEAESLGKRSVAARAVDVFLVRGGGEAKSEPCEPLSPHGFLGVEDEVVIRIANFIRGNR